MNHEVYESGIMEALSDLAEVANGFKAEADSMRSKGGYRESDIDMYYDDSNDMMKLYDMIADGDFKSAAKKAAYMDTIIRECIPESVWGLIEPYY